MQLWFIFIINRLLALTSDFDLQIGLLYSVPFSLQILTRLVVTYRWYLVIGGITL